MKIPEGWKNKRITINCRIRKKLYIADGDIGVYEKNKHSQRRE